MTNMRTGYNGQRYEVWYKDHEGNSKVFGWTDHSDGQPLVGSINLHPSMSDPRVVDLHAVLFWLEKGKLGFECPGCGCAHYVRVSGNGPRWTWNYSMDKPTFSPSLLVRTSNIDVCHSFVKDGKIQFLGDCTHELKNQTVEIPKWHSPAT